MKTFKKLSAFAMVLLVANIAYSACEPAAGTSTRFCIGCGNLQENPVRGVDLVWNWLQADPAFADRLRYSGNATVILHSPPNASDGVTFYWGGITDEGFSVVNTDSYAELMRVRAGLTGGRWAFDLELSETQLEQLSIQRDPNAPYTISLYDQNGNLFYKESLSKVTPPILDRANYSIAENAKDAKYRQVECIVEDEEEDDSESDDSESEDAEDWENEIDWFDNYWDDEGDGDCSACTLHDWNEETDEWDRADWTDPDLEREL